MIIPNKFQDKNKIGENVLFPNILIHTINDKYQKNSLDKVREFFNINCQRQV